MTDSSATDGVILSGPSVRQRLVGGGIWALAGQAGSLVLALAVNALITRILTPNDAGTYFLGVSVGIAAVTVAQFGLPAVSTRLVAEAMAKGEEGRARDVIRLTLRLGHGIAALTAGLFLAPPVQHLLTTIFPSTRIESVAFPISALILLRALAVQRAETFRGFHEIGKATVLGWFSNNAFTALGLAILWLFFKNYSSLTLALFLTAAAWLPAFVAGSSLLRRRARILHQGIGQTSHREVLRISVPLFGWAAAGFVIAQADLWVVGANLDAQEIAIYGAALRLSYLLGTPLLIMNLVLPPLVAELFAQHEHDRLERTVRATATAAFVPTLCGMLLFAIAGTDLLGLIFGDFYRDGATVLLLLALGPLSTALFGPTWSTLAMTGHERHVFIITAGSAALMVIGALLVVGTFGTTGVAAVAGGAVFVANLVAWSTTRRLLGIWTHAGVAPSLTIARTLRTTLLRHQR